MLLRSTKLLSPSSRSFLSSTSILLFPKFPSSASSSPLEQILNKNNRENSSNNHNSGKLKLYNNNQHQQYQRKSLLHQTEQDKFFNKYLEKAKQQRSSSSAIMPKARTKATADEAKAKTQAILKSVNLTLEKGPSVDPSDKNAAPKDWNMMYNSIVRMRAHLPAPVDVIGCHMLADRENCDAETQRWQTLVALMLSSQTRDQMTAAGVKGLIKGLKGGLTVASVAKSTEDQIRACISMTCFYNNKAKYLKQSALLLQKDYDGKVPRDIKEILKMPGVGKKMAHIFKECADGEIVGIGVDTHMHRMFRKWKWADPKKYSDTPDETMKAMQRWLPLPYWKHVNEVMVGFGQQICKSQGAYCESCLARHWCPASEAPRSQKLAEKHLQTDHKQRAIQDIEDLMAIKEKTAVARQKVVEEYGFPSRECEWLAPPAVDMSKTGDQSKTANQPVWIRSTWFDHKNEVFPVRKSPLKKSSNSAVSVGRSSPAVVGAAAAKKKAAKKADVGGSATKKLSKYFDEDNKKSTDKKK